jgi:uncharacterized protein YoxC
MGVTGAYIQKFTVSASLQFARMKFTILDAISGSLWGLTGLVTGLDSATRAAKNNVANLELQFTATIFYISDLTAKLNANVAAQRSNGAASDRLSGQAEALGYKLAPVVEQLDKVGGAGGKAAKATYDYATALKEGLLVALNDAQDALKDAEKTLTDFAENVAKSLLDAFSFSDAKEAGDETGKGFLSGLRNQVNGIKDYSNDIQHALNLGLSQDSLKAVLAAGSDAGAAIAKELVKGGETAIFETNALVDSANMAAQKVGINAATAWYQVGVDNAQKTVNGLQTEIDKLTPKMMKQMDALANKLARTVDITVRVNEIVTSVQNSVSAPVSRQSVSDISSQSVGDTYNINVAGVMSNAQTGEEIVNNIRAYNRAAGPANISIA